MNSVEKALKVKHGITGSTGETKQKSGGHSVASALEAYEKRYQQRKQKRYSDSGLEGITEYNTALYGELDKISIDTLDDKSKGDWITRVTEAKDRNNKAYNYLKDFGTADLGMDTADAQQYLESVTKGLDELLQALEYKAPTEQDYIDYLENPYTSKHKDTFDAAEAMSGNNAIMQPMITDGHTRPKFMTSEFDVASYKWQKEISAGTSEEAQKQLQALDRSQFANKEEYNAEKRRLENLYTARKATEEHKVDSGYMKKFGSRITDEKGGYNREGLLSLLEELKIQRDGGDLKIKPENGKIYSPGEMKQMAAVGSVGADPNSPFYKELTKQIEWLEQYDYNHMSSDELGREIEKVSGAEPYARASELLGKFSNPKLRAAGQKISDNLKGLGYELKYTTGQAKTDWYNRRGNETVEKIDSDPEMKGVLELYYAYNDYVRLNTAITYDEGSLYNDGKDYNKSAREAWSKVEKYGTDRDSWMKAQNEIADKYFGGKSVDEVREELNAAFTDHGYDMWVYADYKERIANAEEMGEFKEGVAAGAQKDPFVSSALSIGTNLGSWRAWASSGMSAIGNIQSKLGGDHLAYRPVDPNSTDFEMTAITQTIRGTVGDKIASNTDWELWGTNVAKFLYDTGMSMGDFLAATAVTGGSNFSLALMGTSSAGSSAYQVLQNGGSTEQAFMYGTLTGLTEVLTEKFSLDGLKAFQSVEVTGPKSWLMNALKQTFTEMTEETAASVADTVWDELVNGDNSAYNQAVADYMSRGYTQSQAQQMALQNKIVETMFSALGGALSGFSIGLAAGGVNYMGNKNAQKSLQAKMDEAIGYTSEAFDLSTYEGQSRVLALADTVDRLDAMGLIPEGSDLVERAQSIRDRVNNNTEFGFEKYEYQPVEQNEIKSLYLDTAMIVSNDAESRFEAEEREYADPVTKVAESMADVEQTTEPIETVHTDRPGDQSLQEMDIDDDVTETSVDITPELAPVVYKGEEAKVIGITKGGKVKLMTAEGEVSVSTSELTSDDDNTNYILKNAAKMESVRSANLYVTAYDPNIDPEAYTKAYKKISEMVYDGEGKVSTMGVLGADFSDGIDADTASIVYDELVRYKRAAEARKIKGAPKDVEGRVRGRGLEKVDAEARIFLEEFAKSFKVDINVVDDTGDGSLGSTNPLSRRITLSIKSANELSTLLHESGHLMKAWDSDTFYAIQDAVCDWFAKYNNTTLEHLIEMRQAEYTEKEGKTCSYQEAKDEVTCNAIEAIQTADNFAEEFTQTMADLQYPKAEAEGKLTALQKFFRKIKLALNNILERIRNKRSGDLMITAEGKYIAKRNRALVDDLLKKVRQGLVNVRTNYDSYVAGAEVKSAGDGKVKHMYGGEITAGTSEEERARILEGKSIGVHYYDTKNDIIIGDFSNSLYSEEISQIKKGLIAVAEKYGIVDKKNTIFFANVDLEYEVGTTFGTFKESAGKQSDDIGDLVRMLPIFKEVFNDAVVIEVHKNRYYNDENTVSFVELLGGYVHNGYFVPVRFGVKTFSKDSPKLYVVVSQNKIEVERLGLSSQTESEPHGPASTSTISISKIIRNVNPKDTKLLRYLPSTMLDNKQKQGKRKGVIDSKTYTNEKNDKAYEKHYEREKGGIYKETKRMLRAKARAEGYIEGEDGYLYKDDSKKTKEVTFDDDGNLIPITQRYDESNLDVRYQHLSSEEEEQAKADELEALREENKALKAMDKRRWQMIDYLQKQLDQWKRGGKKLDYRGIEKLARALIKEYGANVDVKAYAKELTGFFNYMTNNAKPSADVIKKRYTELAEKLIHNVEAVNPEVQEQLKNIRHIIREGIVLNVNQRGDVLHRFETMAKYREKVGSTVKITSKGIPLDDAWKELSAMYPDLFPEDTTDADQPIVMAEVIATLNDNLKYNPIAEEYLGNEEAALMDAVAKIVDGFYNIPELVDAKSAYKSAYAEAKVYYDEYYKKWYNSKVKTLQRANADRYDQYRESRAKTDEKAKIKRLMKKLSSALLSPTEGNYVPTELYESIIDICRAVNLTNNYETKVGKKFERFQQQYEALKSVTKGDYAGEHDEVMADRIKRLNEMMGERSIASLTLSELMELRHILQDVSNTLMDARIQIGVKEKIANYELGDRAIREIRDADKYRALNKKYSGNMLSSMRLVDMICDYDPNAVLNVKFRELNEGVRKMNQFIMESSKPFEKLQEKNKGKDYEDFITKTYDVGFVDENGNAVPVTMAQMCQIRLSYEREQADSRLEHIKKGGIIIPDRKLVEQGKLKEAIDKGVRVRNIGSITIDNINETLNDYAKLWLDTASDFFNVRSKSAINEVSRVTMHRNVATSGNYIPFEVAKNFVSTEVEAVSFNASLQSMGILQSITHSAPQPIVVMGLNSVVDRHIQDVGKQYGLAIPIRNLNKIYRVQQVGGNDSVKNALNTTWEKNGASGTAQNIVEQVLADMQSNRKSDTWEVLNKIHDGVVQAVLNGNLSVSIKQAASYWAAGYIVSEGALHKGLLRTGYVLKNMQSVFDEIDQHAGAQHYMRRKGLSIQEIGDLVQKKHFSDKLPSVLNGRKWIQAVDVFTTALIWEACKIDVSNNVKKGKAKFTVGSEEYFKAVAEEYNNAIEQTQPMYDVLHRPEIQKNKNALSREIFMFKTQSFQNSGILQSSFGRLQAAKRHLHNGGESAQAEYDEARKRFGSALISQGLSLIVLTAMTVLANGFALHKLDKYRNEDGEIDIASFFREVGLVFGGNAATLILPYSSTVFSLADFARSKLTGSTFYGASSPTLDFINGFTESALKLTNQIDVLRDGDKKGTDKLISVGGALFDVLAKYCEFKGIAMSNAVNILNSIRLYAEGAINGTGLESGYQQSESQVYQLMYEAVYDGDTDTYEEYKKQLMSGYHTSSNPIEGIVGYFTKGKPVSEKDITDGIAKVLRSDEKVHSTALYYLSSDFYNYEAGLSELEKIGFNEEMVNKATNAVIDAATVLYKADVGSEEYDDAEEKLYEYGFGAEDIAAMLDAIENIEVFDGEGSLTSRGLKYSYKMLAEAVVDGDVDSAVRMYTYLTDEAEKEDKTIRSQLTQYIKPIYKQATQSERNKIRQLLMKHCGYKFNSFQNWLKD